MSRASTPLSSVESERFEDDDAHDVHEAPEHDNELRPLKRQRLGAGSTTSSAVVPEADPEHVHAGDDLLEGLSDLSSDTSGDIPSSPINAKLEDEDFQEQITVCDWDGCDAGDQGNMDRLVKHIHDSHIENRQKKYTCEWNSCNRKGLPHASGYALKAHMRSHTREKPFYCYLPECDRSFTRSDALAKHMRTVHETEALRPSDPVPKNMTAPAAKARPKIVLKTPNSHNGVEDPNADPMAGEEHNVEYFTPLTSELFSEEELAFGVDKLYRKCHWEAKWAEEIGETLKKECEEVEEVYYKEWLEKEALLSQVIKSEVAWHERRDAILTGMADVKVSAVIGDATQESDTPANGEAEAMDVTPSQNATEVVA